MCILWPTNMRYQLFYLLSRGISKASAEELLVNGFLDEVLKRLKNEEIADLLRKHLKEKFSS